MAGYRAHFTFTFTEYLYEDFCHRNSSRFIIIIIIIIIYWPEFSLGGSSPYTTNK